MSFQNLLRAAKLAGRGKRFKNTTARFNFYLERELWNIHEDLIVKKYEPGEYRHFVIYEPKERTISAAPYRDRVVHHAIHNILEPIFDPTFISDSYATRRGKGTHAAIDRFQEFSRSRRYVLKCDIRKYFPSIDHQILMKLIKRKIACDDTLWLIQKVLDSHCRMAGNLPASQPASQPAIGIPIGNLTSQFFANVYLNGLDHFIKEKLRCECYLRYMDDFVLFHDDKDYLWQAKKKIMEHLDRLQLSLHERKCRVYDVTCGVSFLGLIVFPNVRRLKKANLVRFKKRLKRFQELHMNDSETWPHIYRSIRSWIGHASHANTMQLRKLMLEEVVFRTRKGD
ncbi:MAG: reverse transcriptase/maturase family protein [Pseudomonadota bacterium]